MISFSSIARLYIAYLENYDFISFFTMKERQIAAKFSLTLTV